MKILNLFDKDKVDKKLHIGWGLSILVNDKILFDTGEKGSWLLANMQRLKIDIAAIETVVISHDHWDHTGGLGAILKSKKGIKVYGCPNFSKEFKVQVNKLHGQLVEADRFVTVAKDIFITGEIPGAYKGKYMPEQALVLKTKKGITIITGCAHPGILKIVEKVRAKYPAEPIYLVLGGFHLMESDERAIEIVVAKFKKMGIIKAGPTHCSGETAESIFKKQYGRKFVRIKTGQTIEV
ncbi:MAG: MBL fold metallo-hydrolase [bacterium]|nr:MBL fold metallo-hydrolase [bacterium]MDD5756606.1 MBL fold metallo-hydrolase [bacterium]